MNLVSRDQWGARPPRDPHTPIPTPTAHLILHHFAADWPGPEGMRRCQNLHMDDRRYDDIAYTLMVDADAVYVGRGPGVQGAHTRGWNVKAHAVAAAIDGGRHVEDGVIDRLAEAAVWLWRQGAVEDPFYDGGHRNYGNTACPGDRLQVLLPEINRRAGRLVKEHTVTAKRIAGQDRHETCAMLAYTGWPTSDHQRGVVFIALTESPDMGGAVNVANTGPVLTVEKDRLPAATAAALKLYRPSEVVALGGPGVVPDKVLEQARRAAAG